VEKGLHFLGPGPPGQLSALSVFPSKSNLHGTFVRARGALNSLFRRFSARAVDEMLRNDAAGRCV
jgi:hypothetical protein